MITYLHSVYLYVQWLD